MRPQSSPGDTQALRPGPGPTRAEAPFVSHGRELLSGARIPPNGKQRPLRYQRGDPLGSLRLCGSVPGTLWGGVSTLPTVMLWS